MPGRIASAPAAALLILFLHAACQPAPAPDREQTLAITELLGGADDLGFARAVAPRRFAFPDDHGPHPSFRTEWWYFTGNLESASGRRFGYQLTFFRNGLVAAPAARASAWAASEVYMGHFAVTDPASASFTSHERFARAAGGLAGAGIGPFRVWLEDWSATGGEELPPIRLRAVTTEAGIDLSLAPGKPPVAQGDDGLSRKGREAGNASYYYSLTRLPTTGRLVVGGVSHAVDGLSWLDREWSTSSLDTGVVGWDWFALQLDDGRDLMFYRLRREDGSTDPLSAGSLVAVEGGAETLTARQVAIETLARWRSPTSGRTYPASWRLRLPSRSLELEIEPLQADQELRHTFVYWEGAVRCRGTAAGRPVAGYGYVELTGYD